MSSPLDVHLEHYEGPLDLLLDLIRKQQIDIWNIPIARITAQYLEYLERLAELAPGARLDVAFSFAEDDYAASRGLPGWCAILKDVRRK